MGSDLEETTSQDHETMSGNEPYSEENPEFADTAAGDIYGAPRSNVERTGPAAGELAAPLPLREPKHGESDGLDLREPASLGNRPASGARVVSVSEVFSEHFIGAEGASDFLGLDTEFDPTPVGSPGSAAFVMADVARATNTEVEYQRGMMAPLGPAADPAPYPGGAEYVPSAPLEDLPPADESFEDDGLAEEFELEPAPRRSKAGLVVGVLFALGAAAAGAYFLAPGLFGKKAEEPAPVVARKTPEKPKKTETPDPVAVPEPEKVEPAPRPIEDFSTTAPSAEPSFETPLEPAPEGELVVEEAPALDPLDPAAGDTGVAPITATELELLLGDAMLSEGFYEDNSGMLDLVWRGETVPMEAIGSPNRILTPAVGPVRVHLQSGTVFDGRLFALGENKVWVDVGLGRMGLDGAQVVRIEWLPKDIVLPEGGGPIEVVMGERVRARVAGGVIYGWVRNQEGNVVNLVTESGARITLVDALIEPAGDPKRVALKL